MTRSVFTMLDYAAQVFLFAGSVTIVAFSARAIWKWIHDVAPHGVSDSSRLGPNPIASLLFVLLLGLVGVSDAFVGVAPDDWWIKPHMSLTVAWLSTLMWISIVVSILMWVEWAMRWALCGGKN